MPKLAIELRSQALLYGTRSLFWVGIIFGLCNYLFSVLGVILFRENDPFYFGSIWKAFATIWLVETLNNWEQPMLINVYGCDQYGYGQFQGRRMGESYYNLPVKLAILLCI